MIIIICNYYILLPLATIISIYIPLVRRNVEILTIINLSNNYYLFSSTSIYNYIYFYSYESSYL
jgi:hypothetical protein